MRDFGLEFLKFLGVLLASIFLGIIALMVFSQNPWRPEEYAA